jgi:O-antigen ligase
MNEPHVEPQALGRLIAWTLGLAPVLLFILTWSTELIPLQRLARSYALPVVAVEVGIVIVSLGEGFRLPRMRTLPMVLLAALGLLVWVTAIAAPFPLPSVFRTFLWTVHLLFAVAAINLWRQRLLDPGLVAQSIQTGFLLVLGLLVVFVGTAGSSVDDLTVDLPAFNNIRWFGYYAAVCIGLAAPGFLRGDRFALLTATAAFAGILWTGSRAATVGVLVGYVVAAVLFSPLRTARVWQRLGLCAVVGALASIVLSVVLPIEGQGLGGMAERGTAGRILMWKRTIASIAERPWFGWGEGQVAFFPGRELGLVQPHNVILQILHAWGVVGLLLIFALATYLIRPFLKPDDRAIPFKCAALTLVAISLVDSSLYQVHSLSLFALCMAMALAPASTAGNEFAAGLKR